MTKIISLLFILLITLFNVGCKEADELKALIDKDDKNEPVNEKNEPPTAEELQDEIRLVAQQIDETIGTATCTNSNQCGALAVGHKACGGPASFLAYSTENTDTTKLFDLASKHQALSKSYNQAIGAMSDCAMVMQPVMACIDNICQKQAP